MSKLLVLNSGGFDSATVLSLMKASGHEVSSLFFDYKQRSLDMERESAWKWVDKLKIARHDIMKVDLSYAMKKEQYYIPSRNVVFFSLALSFAESNGLDGIVCGLHKCDTYMSDNSPEFFNVMREITQHVGVDLIAPLLHADKKQVYELGMRLGVNPKEVWSCDFPTADSKYCGKCPDCELLAEHVNIYEKG